MKNKEKFIGSIVMVIGCTIFLIVGYVLSKPKANNNEIALENNISANQYQDKVLVDNSKEAGMENNNGEEYKDIIVEIKGEVKNPDVYSMKTGDRVIDLVKKAGGFTEKAYKLGINLSMKLKDEDCIIIYNKDVIEKNPSAALNVNVGVNTSHGGSTKNSEIININTATKEELMTLPGIGEVTAEKIIQYREENGEFKSIDELTQVDRIGEKTLNKFKDKIGIR